MKNLAILALSGLFFAPPAWALSCAPAQFNESTIENAAAVFEGKALGIVPGKSAENKVVYKFGVNRGFKGVSGGFITYVEVNAIWGDRFEIGKDYLVVASEKNGDAWVSPLCGTTAPAEFATAQLKLLEQWCLTNTCPSAK